MSIKQRLGDHSWFTFARQANCDTPVTHLGSFVQNRFPFTSLELDVESELQESDAIAGRRSDTKDQQGQLWGSGAIETELYIEKMEEFWQAILNSSPPKSYAVLDTHVSTVTTFSTDINRRSGFADITTPGQIEVDLSDATNAISGSVTITGGRRVGLSSTDLLPVTETVKFGNNKKAKTDTYFAKLDRVEFHNMTGVAAGDDVDTIIRAQTAQIKYIYKNSDEIFPGWTMQLVRGNVPAVAEGAVPVNSTLTIGENIRLNMEILARRITPFRQIGDSADKFSVDNGSQDYDFIDDTFYPNWGGLLEVEDACLIFTDLTLNINQNLDFLPGIKASRYRLPVAPTGEPRNVTLNATVYYEIDEADKRWENIFRDNLPRRLTTSCYYWDSNGKQSYQKFSMPSGYLTASPRIGVDSRGPITRELAFKAVPESRTEPDEIEIRLVV